MPAAPLCRLGGVCVLAGRDALLGVPGVAQCRNCSEVYSASAWVPRACEHCGLMYGESLHDPCLGHLDGVVEACCGHGDEAKAYRRYADGRREGMQ